MQSILENLKKILYDIQQVLVKQLTPEEYKIIPILAENPGSTICTDLGYMMKASQYRPHDDLAYLRTTTCLTKQPAICEYRCYEDEEEDYDYSNMHGLGFGYH